MLKSISSSSCAAVAKFCMMVSAVLLIGISTSHSQENFPQHPIRLIVPYAPGGTTDLLSRIVAKGLGKELGQPVVVENRDGAAGMIGTGAVVKAKPDGYTLGMGGTTSLTLAPYMRLHPLYDTRKDIAMISGIITGPFVLVTSPRLNVNSFEEFVKLAKSKPGELNYGSSGVGGMHHVLTEKFNNTVGIKALHVPFKGGSENTSNLLAGNIDYMLESVSSILPMIQDGRVKAFAVTGEKRIKALPDVPTVSELTSTDFVGDALIGVIGPKGLPETTISRLNAALEKTMKQEEVRKGIENLGSVPVFIPSNQFGGRIFDEIDTWGKIANQAGIQKQ